MSQRVITPLLPLLLLVGEESYAISASGSQNQRSTSELLPHSHEQFYNLLRLERFPVRHRLCPLSRCLACATADHEPVGPVMPIRAGVIDEISSLYHIFIITKILLFVKCSPAGSSGETRTHARSDISRKLLTD